MRGVWICDYFQDETRCDPASIVVLQKVTEAQASSARAEMNLLAQRIGHDLRAPLRALKTVPQWIREELEEGAAPIAPKTDEYLSMIERQAERMDQYLIGLLEYSNVASADAKTTDIDPKTEFETVLQELAPEGSYTIEIAPELVELQVARSDFTAIVRHLITNAMRHHDRQDGHIWVRGSRDGRLAKFEVQDDGPGIAEQDRERVFEPFVTLKPRDQVEGSGLGLAIAHKIIVYWGGTISVGPADGRGSVFRFQFPANPFCETEPDGRRSRGPDP